MQMVLQYQTIAGFDFGYAKGPYDVVVIKRCQEVRLVLETVPFTEMWLGFIYRLLYNPSNYPSFMAIIINQTKVNLLIIRRLYFR